jgi:hypothetical protein
MGKQIRFYMDEKDENDFVRYLSRTGNVVILPQTSQEELGETFSCFSQSEGRPLGENCRLWNRSISPKPTIKYFPEKGYFWLDSLQSEVVDVMRSRLAHSALSMGRLWIEPMILESTVTLKPKGERFMEWFSTLCRWIKHRSVRVIDGAYVLPGAESLIAGGVQVTGHRP